MKEEWDKHLPWPAFGGSQVNMVACTLLIRKIAPEPTAGRVNGCSAENQADAEADSTTERGQRPVFYGRLTGRDKQATPDDRPFPVVLRV